MTWSPQQDAAIRSVTAWYRQRNRPPVYRLFGYAGTGKTTLAKEIAGAIKGKVLYATFTGKAALVLREKGCHGASTIHSLLYRAEVDEETGDASFVLNPDSDLADAKLLIVDEVSMVPDDLARDMLSFNVPILVLGDPAQLPPINGEGFFINAEPDTMLTEVHRQAAGNPIIRMSMDIREGRPLHPGAYGESMVLSGQHVSRDQMRELVLDADQLLCGLNRTRTAYNGRIRALKGLHGPQLDAHPVTGDRLICLRNKREKHLFNGGLWEVQGVDLAGEKLKMRVTSLDEDRDPVDITTFEHFFTGRDAELDWRLKRGTEEFTYGWAITCHKSQGSQWNNVIVFDESKAFREARANWIYTAVTRAAERVTVVL